MTSVERPLRLTDLRRDPELFAILLDHASRGVRVQMFLRAALAAFVVITVFAVPPLHDRPGCYAIAVVYAVWVVGVSWRSRRGGERAVRLIWLALLADVIVLAAVTVLAGISDQQSWTADILVSGFFLVPMVASAQLRPEVAAAVTVPAIAVYLGSSIAARHANTEPWSSVLLRTGVLAAISIGCVVLSWLQRSRVLTIAGLIMDRSELLSRLVDVDGQARRELAEELHDGALQYILAARQDLDDARHRGDAESFDRVAYALTESTKLLRSKVSQLHPAVLEQSGLRRALEDLVRTTAAHSSFSVELLADGWDPAWRLPTDELLYAAARELLVNVAKHAQAQHVRVCLQRGGGLVTLIVSDDGIGLDEAVLDGRLAEGHIGVASQRVRAEASGGHFRLRDGHPGTIAEVALPDPATS